MNISIEQKREYPEIPQVVIKCRERNNEVEQIVRLLKMQDKKIIGIKEQSEHVISPEDIIYCESVDGAGYCYTKDAVYRISLTLAELEANYEDFGFFRCSKSAVLNIHAIERLKSEVGNRIDACMVTGEHIIISRRYAKELRRILRGGEDE